MYLSVDPSLRPRMNAVSEYAGPVAIGGLIPASALGVVVESFSPLFVPESVQTVEDVVENVTGLPERPPVAVSAKGASPKFLLAGGAKLMTCAAFATLKLCVTGAAAP